MRSGVTIVVAADADADADAADADTAVLGLASAQVALLLRPPPWHCSRCMTTLRGLGGFWRGSR